MRKALFLTRQFPPFVTDGASRAWKFALHLPESGWKSLVVAPPGLSGPDMLPQGTAAAGAPEIHRTGPDFDASELGDDERAALLCGHSLPSRRPLARLSGLFREDSAGVEWQKSASQLVERLLAEHPDIELLYAQGPPLEPLMLALEIARRHRLAVVLDIMEPLDPAMPQPGTTSQSSGAKAEEQILLSGVPMITPTRALKEYFLKKYQGRLTNGAMTIVPDGYDASHPVFRLPAGGNSSAVMRWAFIVENVSKREIKTLLTALDSFVNADGLTPGGAEFTFFGDGAREVARSMAKRPSAAMIVTGPFGALDRELELLRKADLVCTVLGSTDRNTCIVPGRMVDALGLRRPLSGVMPAGSAERIVTEAGGMTALPGDAAGILALFRSSVEQWRTRSLPGAHEEFIRRHDIKVVLHELTGAIAGQHV